MQIKINTFGGEIPKISSRLLPDQQAVSAVNCDLSSGAIDAVPTDMLESDTADTYKSIYKYTHIQESWLGWDGEVSVVKNPVADDVYNRIYYTGDGSPKMRYIGRRISSFYYSIGFTIYWEDSPTSTKWVATTAGMTADTAPAITGIPLGGTVVDGQVIWRRYPDNTTIERSYNAGIPAPTGKITAVAADKTATSWTKTWRYWYEESDSTKIGEADLPVDPTETTIGSVFTLASASVPARPTAASASAVFVMYLQVSSSTGAILGRVYPDISQHSISSDLYINGAKVSATQTTSGDRVFTLSYDTSDNSEYTVDRSYVYTLVSILGEEGPPSEPSDMIAVPPNQDALLSGMDTAQPAGGYNIITRKRIYRTVTSSIGTQYQFVSEMDLLPIYWDGDGSGVADRAYSVGEVAEFAGVYYECVQDADTSVHITNTAYWTPLGTEQFRDFFTDAEVGEVLASNGWDLPEETLDGIVVMPGAFCAAFSGNTIYFSEINFPHAWPAAYSISIEDNIVGLGVSGNTLTVLTDRYPYLITAQSPLTAMVSKLSSPQSCISKRSIVESGGAIIYASPDGVCVAQSASVVVATDSLFSKEQWRQYRTVSGAVDDTQTLLFVYDNFTYVVTANKILRFRFGDSQNALQEITGSIIGYYDNRSNDTMYVISSAGTGRGIYSLLGGSTKRSVSWTSKEFSLSTPQKWSVAKVTSSAYPVVMTVYANATAVCSLPVTSDVAFRLPLLRKEKFWSVNVAAAIDCRISEIVLSTSFSEL